MARARSDSRSSARADSGTELLLLAVDFGHGDGHEQVRTGQLACFGRQYGGPAVTGVTKDDLNAPIAGQGAPVAVRAERGFQPGGEKRKKFGKGGRGQLPKGRQADGPTGPEAGP